MKLFRNSLIALALIAIVAIPSTRAHAATLEEMLAQIQTLMAQITLLQNQLGTMRNEVTTLLKTNLVEGMSDADIAKIQEILATDPTIYPEGRKSGYYGPLTAKAITRFQIRHGLEATGRIDQGTHDLLQEYLREKQGSTTPYGLLQTPGIVKKIEMRYEQNCHKQGRSDTNLCQKLRIKYEDRSSDDSSDDDSYDDSDGRRNDSDDDYDDDDSDEDEDEDEDDDRDDDSDEDEDDDNSSGNTGNIPTTTTPVSTGTISTATVATHNTASSCWLIVSGKAYDVTQYAPFHPGGKSAITSRCGTDATTLFTSNSGSGHKHSSSAQNQLNKYYVGTMQ